VLLILLYNWKDFKTFRQSVRKQSLDSKAIFLICFTVLQLIETY